MSLFTFITDHRAIARELKRCADALERLAPPTGDDKPRTPADADDVSYATDEGTARQELRDEMDKFQREFEEEHEE